MFNSGKNQPKQASIASFFGGVTRKPSAELDEFGNPVDQKKTKRVKLFTKEKEKKRRDLSKLYVAQIEPEELELRTVQMNDLREEMLRVGLPLCGQYKIDDDNKFVFGEGPMDATLMIIGEAPGREEAQEGKPFVGKSGIRINENLEAVGIDRNRHCYVTNLIKVQPFGNRDPSFEEISMYLPYLARQVEIIKPRMIMCFGRFACTIVKSAFKLTDERRGAIYDRASRNSQIAVGHQMKTESIAAMYRNSNNSSAIFVKAHKMCYRTYYSFHPGFVFRQEEREIAEYLESKGLHPELDLHTLESGYMAPIANKWRMDFDIVAQNLTLPALKFIDAREYLGPIDDAGFPYNSSYDVFFNRGRMNSQDIAALETEGKFEFEIFTCRYISWLNTFIAYGRTRGGKSVRVLIQYPQFRFTVTCGDITRLDSEDIQSIDRLIRAAIGQHVDENRNNYKEGAFCNVESVQRRPYFGPHPKTKQMLEFTFSHYALKEIIFEEMKKLFPTVKSNEKDLKSVAKAFLDRNIFNYGWVTIPWDSSLRIDSSNDNYQDLEVTVNYAEVKGISPNTGESPELKYEDMSHYKVLSIDAEMLNPVGFPSAEQNPIVSICAYGQTFNRPEGEVRTEKRRSKKDLQKTRLTGRANYDLAVAFTIGPVKNIDNEVFKPKYLPEFPSFPIEKNPKYKRGVNDDGDYTRNYVIAIRTWNKWIGDFVEWRKQVGSLRVSAVLNDSVLEAAVLTLEERPDGTKKRWEYDKCIEWEKCIRVIVRHNKNRLSIDNIGAIDHRAVNLASKDELQQLFEENQIECEKLFGELQVNWSHFHKEKQVFCFEIEDEMIHAWCQFVKQYDPDNITGWNVCDFDLKYIIARIRHLDLRDAKGKYISMGRVDGKEDFITTKRSVSRARGERLFTEIHIEGREVYDMLHSFLNEIYGKLNSYRLASVAEEFLGDTKNDVPYSAIPSLFRNNNARLNDYCLKDAELVMMLINVLNTIPFVTLLSRRIGIIDIGHLNSDGQQGKVLSILMRFLEEENLDKVFPDVNLYSAGNAPCGKQEASSYVGATCLEVEVGLHEDPVPVLDFNALYPNIMITENYSHDTGGTAAQFEKAGFDPKNDCFETYKEYLNPWTGEQEPFYFLKFRRLLKSQLALHGLKEEDCYLDNDEKLLNPETAEKETCYIPKIDRGAYDMAAKKLLDLRANIKRDMKFLDPTSLRYQVLDLCQLVMKILVNSMYGAMGVMVGKLAFRPAGEAVTLMGRESLARLIEKMKSEFGARIIGGDTDSIFPKFPDIKKIEDVFEITEYNCVQKPRIYHILDVANSLFKRPMELALDHVYVGYWPQKKKRAVYMQYEPYFDTIEQRMAIQKKGEIYFKGVEARRRDGCELGKNIFFGFCSIVLERRLEVGLHDASLEAAKYVRKEIEKLRDGQIPYHQLIQTRQYSNSNYATDNLPHVQVIKKLKRRGEPVPQLGDRVPFIIVSGRKGIKRYQSAEDPDFALRNNLQPDLKYIEDLKVRGPIQRFSDILPLGEKLREIMFGSQTRIQRSNLLEDDDIMGFVKPLLDCEMCGKTSFDMICRVCVIGMDVVAYEKRKSLQRSQLENVYGERLKTCRACMSIREDEEVICGNTDCKEFFPRRVAEFDLLNFDKKMYDFKLLREEVNALL